MTQFQHTLKALLEGRKTETSRIALPESDGTGTFDCEMMRYPGTPTVQRFEVKKNYWRVIWAVGQTYAIQPARGVKSVGRYRVEAIWRQDVRTLTTGQVINEGFMDRVTFYEVWCEMHDSSLLPLPAWGNAAPPEIQRYLNKRPFERYQAWRMTIQVLWDTVDWDALAVKALHIEPKTVY